jgi:ribosomal protein L4
MPHTHTHPVLSAISHEKACDEIVKSQTFLEDLFPDRANIFASPKGVYTKEVVNFLKKREFKAAVGVTEGLVHVDDNLFLLKRNSIDSSTTFAQFKGKLEAIDSYQKLKRR